ncbi:pyridoxamine 5'-phosphate oxidase family protein [Peptoniphilus sp. KCTC 25270]|uniref:pyridoxamine 5'-phosphate oxidase family protein n=1 Tax=Peptoniphilus sp. KCTC 25270 TaxID=2897414 RepID=UPI001E5EAF5C|nr:pyridoxamine 5'-phosphate oxidase family protein [Peptoniphilus sp. KCTC 25270]MCD1147560.1 pyridoxamine 5'-phosphate oxidase family protein [Peptoniphilus sp. KCTC 25270]
MRAIDFLKEARVFYIGTTDGTKGYTRPIGFVMDFGGELAFYSDTRKNIYKQIKEYPKVQIAAIDKKMNTLRIDGEVEFITDDATQKAALAELPMLENLGYSVGDPHFQIYKLKNQEVHLYGFTGEELEIEK